MQVFACRAPEHLSAVGGYGRATRVALLVATRGAFLLDVRRRAAVNASCVASNRSCVLDDCFSLAGTSAHPGARCVGA